MGTHRLLAAAAAAALFTGTPAAAQTAPGRVDISVNAAFQGSGNSFTDRLEFERYLETGSTATQYPVEDGILIDGGVGVRLWKGLGVGVALSAFTRDGVAQSETSVPHPFFDNTPRSVEAELSGLARKETGVHLQARYAFGQGPLRAVISAGPSYLTLEQEIVTDVEYDETYPFDTATFRRAETRRRRGSAVTFNAGADVLCMFSRHFGAGAMVRFAKAPIDLEADGRALTIDAGGLTGGGGLRIAF
jgi:hypothetical protein